MPIQSALESILFVASRPVAAGKLAKLLGMSLAQVTEALAALAQKHNQSESGLRLLENNGQWQMVSDPANRALAERFTKAEIFGELTRPQLETLTVISYCGPITKPELEAIRGVNCSLIVRNLLLRGLIQETEDSTSLLPTYMVTMDYLRHLGLTSVRELPDYESLHQHAYVQQAVAEMTAS